MLTDGKETTSSSREEKSKSKDMNKKRTGRKDLQLTDTLINNFNFCFEKRADQKDVN